MAYRECFQRDCPVQKNGKCLSGNYHKENFDTYCLEKEKIKKYYKERGI